MKTVFIVASWCLAFAATTSVSIAHIISVYSNTSGENGCIEVHPDNKIFDLYVVITPSPGDGSVSSVHISDPGETWQGSGIYVINEVPVFPSTVRTYNPNGFAINFGACIDAPVHVLTLRSLCGSAPPDCQVLWIDAIELRDCAGQSIPIADGYYFGNPVDTLCTLLPPPDRFPPDGATNVPRDVVLSWGEMDGPSMGECFGPDQFSVRFGTTSDPRIEWSGWGRFFDPYGLLQEDTTYYWSLIGMRPGGGNVTTPTWTFSTGPGGPVATEHTTWGKIKALYR